MVAVDYRLQKYKWHIFSPSGLIYRNALSGMPSRIDFMIDSVRPIVETICPSCGREMILLHEIRRAFAENLNVFQCKPCAFSMTEPASWITRPGDLKQTA
jgi:hypothetical protein